MNIHTIRAAALLLAQLALMTQAHSAEIAVPRDGWASWQVDAVEGAPDFCCWSSWNGPVASQKACRLDDKNGNFGSRDDATTDAVRVYARLPAARSSACGCCRPPVRWRPRLRFATSATRPRTTARAG